MRGRVQANGVSFHYLEAGRGPLALCLHGFPDNAHTYDQLLPALASAGFRAVAPFMRGYAPTSLAPDGRYQSVLLAQDAVALIEALGGGRAFVVGHDWGASAAYGAAALAPERVTRLVTIGAAHPASFRGKLAHSYERHKGIWHAYFFQMPFAEQVVAADDFAYLEQVVARRLAGVRSRAGDRAHQGHVPRARRGDRGARVLSPHLPSRQPRPRAGGPTR